MSKIRSKIIVPFILLFVGGTLVTSFVSWALVSQMLDDQLVSRIDRSLGLLSRTDFAVNRPILENLKQIVDADIITYTDKDILAATLGDAESRELIQLLRTGSPASDAVGTDIVYRGIPYRVAHRDLVSLPGTQVVLVVRTSEVSEMLTTVAWAMLGVGAVVVAVMSVVGQRITHSLTAPIVGLVAFARQVAEGQPAATVDVKSDDEIGTLAASFNEMVSQLRKSEARLIRSEKLGVTGLLAARVAHDIRNPLSSIKMQAQLLRTRLQPAPENRTVLQNLLREIDQLERVVKGLLELASPGELNLDTRPVNDVVESVLRQVRPQLTHRKIVIETRLDETLPQIRLDTNRLTQALLNLLFNAADAMTDGGNLLVVTERTGDGAGIRIDVCDDGVGVDPGVRDQVFDPFVSTKREGVGLGLVNTKAVVDGHGGTVELLPRDGKGTRARITLPIGATIERRSKH